MSRKIIIGSIAVALILVVGVGGYYILCQKPQIAIRQRNDATQSVVIKKIIGYVQKESIVSSKIKEKIISQINKSIKQSDIVLVPFKEEYDTNYPETYITISIINFTDKDYLVEVGYEGGEGKSDLKEEKKEYEKLKIGSYKSGGIDILGHRFYPFWVRNINDMKFEIQDVFFPPSGAISRHYLTFTNNSETHRRIQMTLFLGIDSADYVKIDEKNDNQVNYTEKGKRLISNFEDLIIEIINKCNLK